MSANITEHFFTYFNLYVANTPELKKEVYKIRYQVYCEELNYEPPENFPDGMETDMYDDNRSIHCLLKHKSSGLYAGCVRFVLADLEQPETPFPMEKACQHNIDFARISRLHYGEISRLAVISKFRKRKGEKNSATGLILPEKESNPAVREKRKFPVIALSLYLACLSIVTTLNLDHALTIMEARLSRHLRILGIPTELIGDFVEYHGRRGPFRLETTKLLNSMSEDVLSLFRSIHSDLESSIAIHPLSQKYQARYSYF